MFTQGGCEGGFNQGDKNLWQPYRNEMQINNAKHLQQDERKIALKKPKSIYQFPQLSVTTTLRKYFSKGEQFLWFPHNLLKI